MVHKTTNKKKWIKINIQKKKMEMENACYSKKFPVATGLSYFAHTHMWKIKKRFIGTKKTYCLNNK